jgi:hypothetical protein
MVSIQTMINVVSNNIISSRAIYSMRSAHLAALIL